MNAERLLAHYAQISDAPDAVTRLRRFVLDLAVRGKLVPQDASEEPASILLTRISTEKARLLRAGKLRKPKATAPIHDDELPIQLPPSWAWVRLCDIGKLSGGMTPSMNRPDFWAGQIIWLSPKDIKSDEVSDSELKISSIGLAETKLELFRPGCLFMVARSGILKRIFPVSINRVAATANQDIKVLAPFLDGQERYLQIMFRGLTDFLLRQLVKTGTTVQSLKYDEFEQQPFPIPPLPEQHRIVAKVDELMSLCDRLETARETREAARDRLAAASLARLDTPDPETFQTDARVALNALAALTTRPDQIKQLRQTILNLAVRGKLVQQDPKDEPAFELLERITEAKEKSPGRNKPLPTIQTAEKPFDAPTSWQWVRMGQVFSIRTGFAFKSTTYANKGTLVFRVTNFDRDGVFDFSDSVFFPTEKIDTKMSGFLLTPGEIIMVMVGGTIGKTTIVDESILPALLNQNMWRIRSFGGAMSNKFEYLLVKNINQSTEGLTQSTHGHFAMSDFEKRIFPLPPLAEQQRIVAKVDALMALCDRLEASLIATAATRHRLLDALLAEALAPVDARKLEAAE